MNESREVGHHQNCLCHNYQHLLYYGYLPKNKKAINKPFKFEYVPKESTNSEKK